MLPARLMARDRPSDRPGPAESDEAIRGCTGHWRVRRRGRNRGEPTQRGRCCVVTEGAEDPVPGLQPSPEIDTTVPHSARIWNYWLGGKDNYPVDREAGDQFREIYPDIVVKVRACRNFLVRAVTFLTTEMGVRQFLDIGTGLPTADNTHEVAQRMAPECHVVYVDNDPLVLVHARALLTSTAEGVTDYIEADLREPDTIVRTARTTLDFSRPIALMLTGILGHMPDYDQARSIVRRLLDMLAPGSFLVQYDGTNTSESYIQAIRNYAESGAVPYNLRSPEQIAGYFEGLEVLEPGVVSVSRWRAEGPPYAEPAKLDQMGGIGRKPSQAG
jgi:O-methyltransferase involved in polyketide biosynthesis